MTVPTIYAVKTIEPAKMTRLKIYDLIYVSGPCSTTNQIAGLAAGVLSHNKTADMNHPYGRACEMLTDAVNSANEQEEYVNIELQVEPGIGVDDMYDECQKTCIKLNVSLSAGRLQTGVKGGLGHTLNITHY
ncbi:MAG: hypothetical protein ACI9TY_001626 [Alphaproteobacteria bacterium]|jgi:hypothetical protein